MTNLSLRLKTIASLVPNGTRVCDVGTDHAYLPIYLKQSGIARSVIATDLNEKPILNAKKNIKDSGVTGISLRHSDGLSAVLCDEVDTIIIAGMGGEVIRGILQNCSWVKCKNKTYIFQPTTSAEVLRKYLVENGFAIISETPLLENGKIYSIMVVEFTDELLTPNEAFYYIGKIPHTEEGILYIGKQKKRVFECMKALETVLAKQNEFEYYKNVYNALENLDGEK
jgi:tRNA (adenine22-N1)-methyltransferase